MLNTKLYISEGPGSENIETILSVIVSSVAERMDLSIENFDTVALAYSDRYGEAVSDLFEDGVFTDNNSYVGVAKTQTKFIDGLPRHTVLFKDFVFELILQGLSISQNINDWPPELQTGMYTISHELGHCKDAETRGQGSKSISRSLPHGFDLNLIHKYYYQIFIDEFYACFNADRFYSEEYLIYQASQDFDSISRLKAATLGYQTNYNQDDRIYQVAVHSSALIWVYIIQYGKIWAGKHNTEFENTLISKIIDIGFASQEPSELLDRFLESLVALYPGCTEDMFERFIPVWDNIAHNIGYKFEHHKILGWGCYWNYIV